MSLQTDGIVQDRAAAVAARLEQMQLPLNPRLSYNLETMFPKIDGWGAKRDEPGNRSLASTG